MPLAAARSCGSLGSFQRYQVTTLNKSNRRFLLRIWILAIALCLIVGSMFAVELTSDDAARSRPVALIILVTAVFLMSTRWLQKRRLAKALQSPDPNTYLRSVSGSLRRIPHGSQMAAASSATILALYGRHEEAEASLQSVDWHGLPPLIQAQGNLARAAIAYTHGDLEKGLAHADAAAQLAFVDTPFPGSQTSELAIRTYRNLGLALFDRTTDSTEHELRTARTRLPLLGKLSAAWGLSVIAKRNGNSPEYQAMRMFIESTAPHFTPVLQSISDA